MTVGEPSYQAPYDRSIGETRVLYHLSRIDQILMATAGTPSEAMPGEASVDGEEETYSGPRCPKTERKISGPVLLSKDKASVIMAFQLSMAAVHEVRCHGHLRSANDFRDRLFNLNC